MQFEVEKVAEIRYFTVLHVVLTGTILTNFLVMLNLTID